jgi:hypothetical protein
MHVLKGIVISSTEPPSTDVLWIKPVEGGEAFYTFEMGRWKVMKLMDDKGTPSTDDDEPYVPGGGGEVGPNTVGSAEIIDGSVRTVDLNKEVTDKLDDVYIQDNESLYINGTKPE